MNNNIQDGDLLFSISDVMQFGVNDFKKEPLKEDALELAISKLQEELSHVKSGKQSSIREIRFIA